MYQECMLMYRLFYHLSRLLYLVLMILTHSTNNSNNLLKLKQCLVMEDNKFSNLIYILSIFVNICKIFVNNLTV